MKKNTGKENRGQQKALAGIIETDCYERVTRAIGKCEICNERPAVYKGKGCEMPLLCGDCYSKERRAFLRNNGLI